MTQRPGIADSRQLALFDPAAMCVPRAVDVPSPGAVRAIPAAPPTLPAASPEPMPIAGGFAAGVFRHPQAEREIRLHDQLVGYALKRARRRSIGFVVGAEGLSVNAPKWVAVADIEEALREKARWILRKLQEQRERAQRLHTAKIDWRDGTTIPYLGASVIVVLDPRAGLSGRSAVLSAPKPAAPRQAPRGGQGNLGAARRFLENRDAQALPGAPRPTLHVGLPRTATPEQIRDTVQSWLQRQARCVFEERCAHFASRLGVRVTRLALSSAQTRWGSASADGSIRLNWRLIHFAMASIDYVVAHELAHLREMNHSPRFWDVVRSVLPDYERARGSLKDGVVPLLG